MTSSRIRSQHGNVIAADFRPRPSPVISLTLTTETLYRDGHVTLIRGTAVIGGEPAFVTHVLADPATGRLTTL